MSAALAILATLAASPAPDMRWQQCAGDDADAAIAACGAILRSTGQNATTRAAALYDRGNAYRLQDRFALAIADYDAALALRSDYAEALTNRGIAYYALRQYDRAIADYDRAIRLNQNYGNALINRAFGPASPPTP